MKGISRDEPDNGPISRKEPGNGPISRDEPDSRHISEIKLNWSTTDKHVLHSMQCKVSFYHRKINSIFY